MAHELDFSRGRAAMAYRGATPWHGLGQSLEAGADLQTWERAAGMDWEVMRAPVQYAAGNGLQAMEDRHVLYRSDNSAPLGVVSDGYKIVQPVTREREDGSIEVLADGPGFTDLHTCGADAADFTGRFERLGSVWAAMSEKGRRTQ